MNRYLAMLILAIFLTVMIALALAPWIIVGPWRLIKKIGRQGRDSGSIPFRT